jgi:hypothetical protein
MAWIPIYADEKDIIQIFHKLNSDPEIAYIISHGKNKWIASDRIMEQNDGMYYLWHIPGGQLKKYKKTRNGVEEAWMVKNPFKGWKNAHQSDNPQIPFLGSQPNTIEFRANTTGKDSFPSIGMSSFGWIANRYKPIGSSAAKETINWWRRLKNWISKNSISKIPRFGSLDGPEKEIWVLPSAYGKIKNGTARDGNSI